MTLTPSRIIQLALANLEQQRARVVADIDAIRQRANGARPAAAKRKGGSGRKPYTPEQRKTASLAAKRTWAARHALAQSGRSSTAVS